jgi:hypothetical protein
MFRIRFYDQAILPSQLQGRLGACIKALNWVRWKLEVCVQRLMVSYLADQSLLPKKEKDDLLAMFRVDALQERLECEKSQLPAFSQKAPHRYGIAGVGSSLAAASDKPLRSVPATDMISRYMDPRLEKYSRGRNFASIRDESDFEPVTAEEDSNGNHVERRN